MTLYEAKQATPYIVRDICTDDEDLNAFLFSLGCYAGEPITVISRQKKTMVIAVKDSRYCIDSQLAQAVRV